MTHRTYTYGSDEYWKARHRCFWIGALVQAGVVAILILVACMALIFGAPAWVAWLSQGVFFATLPFTIRLYFPKEK